MKKILSSVLLLTTVLFYTGCEDDAKIASKNLSKAADNFEIDRRIIFYNGITGAYMLTIEGKCSVDATNRKLAVTCKIDRNQYKKHFLGLSDNVTWFAEQLYTVDVNVYHHRVTFKPQTLLPDIDFRGSTSSAVKAITPDNKD